jgi:hypothetical protein
MVIQASTNTGTAHRQQGRPANLAALPGNHHGRKDGAGNLSVKSSYIGVIVGGALLGLGFAVAGYCPGTGLTALADGREDALFFIGGGFLGALIYTLV